VFRRSKSILSIGAWRIIRLLVDWLNIKDLLLDIQASIKLIFKQFPISNICSRCPMEGFDKTIRKQVIELIDFEMRTISLFY
jgi:hypothetical protein